jgi:hypothetical protein
VSDTRPPASLLALYVLGDVEGWHTAGETADRIEQAAGDRPDAETLRQALCRLARVGRIRRRKRVHDGVEIVEYRVPNNLESARVQEP